MAIRQIFPNLDTVYVCLGSMCVYEMYVCFCCVRFITQEGHKLELTPHVPAAVTNAVSWRKEGIKYRKNEVFLDVIESVNLLVRGGHKLRDWSSLGTGFSWFIFHCFLNGGRLMVIVHVCYELQGFRIFGGCEGRRGRGRGDAVMWYDRTQIKPVYLYL